MMRRTRRSCLMGGILTGCLSALVSCLPPSAPNSSSQVSEELPIPIDDRAEHGYLGWSACSECHSQRVEEFQRTRHFLALQLPDQMKFPREFEANQEPFVPPGSPVRFDALLSPAPAIRATPLSGEHREPVVSPVAFAYGVGAGTDEVYFTRRGDELFELPVVWLHPQDSWGAALFDPHGSGDLSRPLSPQCLGCHTVWVDYLRGSLNRYGPLEPQLLGVTCERCHGPAKDHVAHHRAYAADTIPAHIVQPKTLSRDRKMDLCAQCHTNTVRYRRPPFSYRPGEPLDESFLVLEMQYPEENRVANQVRYLKESLCYQQSDNLTCITCHDPHHAPQREDPLASSRSCRTCHQPESCGERTVLPGDLQDQCVNCHMPKRNKVQVAFERGNGEIAFPAPRYEHRIAVYPEAGQELLWEWSGTQSDAESEARRSRLARELASHWSQVADEARSQQRFLVAIDGYRTALRFEESAELRERLAEMVEQRRLSKSLWFEGVHRKQIGQLNEAIAAFESLIVVEPDLGRAHYELGTLYAAQGRSLEAVQSLRRAILADANDPSPHVMLGWLEFLKNKPDESLKHYLDAEKIEPWSERIEHMIGRCLARLGRWEEAAQAFQRSLTIDPEFVEAAQSLRQVLRERFSAAEALPQAITAVQATHGKQVELLLTLSEIYRDLEQISESRQTIAVARHIAEATRNPLLSQILTLEESLVSQGADR